MFDPVRICEILNEEHVDYVNERSWARRLPDAIEWWLRGF
jgi:hypothetical protein